MAVYTDVADDELRAFIALYDIGVSMEGGAGPFEAVSWKRTEDIFQKLLARYKKLIRVERDRYWLWVLLQGK